MSEETKPLLERTLLALLLIQLRGIAQDQAADVLICAGWPNPEVAEILGTTTNAIAIRRSRKKKERLVKTNG
jgi:hypothetical protein